MEGDLPLQIRYADTEDQKKLKADTAVHREFKTNEYNTAVYGPASPYQHSSPLSATYPSPLLSRGNAMNTMWMTPPVSPYASK